MKQKIFAVVILTLTAAPLTVGALSYKELSQAGQNVSVYPSGSIANDNGTIYFIRGSTKLAFTNYPAFKGLGYSLINAVKGDLSGYTLSQNNITAANSAHPLGSWLSNKGTIYYLTDQGMIGVTNPEIFLSNGGAWSLVVLANKYDLAILKANPALPVLQTNDQRVYGALVLPEAIPATASPAGAATTTPQSGGALAYQEPVTSTGGGGDGSSPSSIANNIPTISSLSVYSGSIGALVTITGVNFYPTGNTVLFGQMTAATNLATPDSFTLQFIIPATLIPQPCPANINFCAGLTIPPVSVQPGIYDLSVTNPGGTSNMEVFTVQ
jgi:hypothetical protein